MSPILVCLALLPSMTTGERGLQLMKQMGGALRDVETVELTMEYELQNPTRTIKTQVRAVREPMRYWAKWEGSDGSIEYAELNGLKMTYTDENGKKSIRDIPSNRVIMNGASSMGVYGWRTFLDRDRFKDLSVDNCFYIHSEEIEGKKCDLVGLVKSNNDRELITTITYFWIDQNTHLPQVFQIHAFIRGRSDAGPKWFLRDVKLNPKWDSNVFPQIPDQVPVVAVPPAANSPTKTKDWKPGDLCPDLKVDTLDFKSESLWSQISGKTLITFWAPWCGPCLAELEALKEIPETKTKQIQVIAVGVSDSKHNIRKHAIEKQLPFKVLIDPDCERTASAISSAFGVSGIPHAFLFDGHGKLIRQWVGFSSKEELAKNLK